MSQPTLERGGARAISTGNGSAWTGPADSRFAQMRSAGIEVLFYDRWMPSRSPSRAPAIKSRNAAAETDADGAIALHGDDAAGRVLRQFRLVFNAVKTHFQQVEKSAGIGGAQLWALSLIRARVGIRVNDLARAMDVHQSTASNLVKALVEREFVTVEKDGLDGRAVQLRILPAGRRVLRRAPGPFVGVLPAALASLDARTLKRLEADLAKLLEVLEADESGATQPLGG